ncbi:F-box protein [Acrasis kona]|uniref:F-box protein n=1 Tax=Acrasis kona TaxID=1008807 RepID=A0AAW2YXT4_9EUKA
MVVYTDAVDVELEEDFLYKPNDSPLVYNISVNNYFYEEQQNLKLLPTTPGGDPSSSTNKNGKAQQFDNQAERTYLDGEGHLTVHTIDFGFDTLSKIALSYGVLEEDIKRLNNFSDLDLYEKATLLIPKSSIEVVRTIVEDEETQRKARQRKEEACVRQFMRTFNVESEVAHFYLSSANWDTREAAREFREHQHWEKSNNITEADLMKKFAQPKASTLKSRR